MKQSTPFVEQGHDMMAEPFHDMPYDGQHIMNRGEVNMHICSQPLCCAVTMRG